MNKKFRELVDKFLKDMSIPTQDTNEDFPYANLADVGKALIKSRNWIPTLVNESLEINDAIAITKKELRQADTSLTRLERDIVRRNQNLPSSAFKSKEYFKVFVHSIADGTDIIILAGREDQVNVLNEHLDELYSQKEIIEMILRKLEKSNDWLSQYINLQKFELRGLNG